MTDLDKLIAELQEKHDQLVTRQSDFAEGAAYGLYEAILAAMRLRDGGESLDGLNES